MLRIRCIHCGVRDEEEYTFGGPSHVSRPDSCCGPEEWANYLFNRDNPKGVHHERWCHTFGCGRWFNIVRDTVTHEILAAYAIGQPKPDLNVTDAVLPASAHASTRRPSTIASAHGDRRFPVYVADQGGER